MNPLRKKWIDALRSGKYAQYKGQLRCRDSFCCLGVLCDVYGEGKWIDGTVFAEDKVYVTPDGAHMNTSPHVSICEAAGVNTLVVNHAMSMNDNERKSFAEIADYIESLP